MSHLTAQTYEKVLRQILVNICLNSYFVQKGTANASKYVNKYKIHNLKPCIATSRCFPKANFILGHPVDLQIYTENYRFANIY